MYFPLQIWAKLALWDSAIYLKFVSFQVNILKTYTSYILFNQGNSNQGQYYVLYLKDMWLIFQSLAKSSVNIFNRQQSMLKSSSVNLLPIHTYTWGQETTLLFFVIWIVRDVSIFQTCMRRRRRWRVSPTRPTWERRRHAWSSLASWQSNTSPSWLLSFARL